MCIDFDKLDLYAVLFLRFQGKFVHYFCVFGSTALPRFVGAEKLQGFVVLVDGELDDKRLPEPLFQFVEAGEEVILHVFVFVVHSGCIAESRFA